MHTAELKTFLESEPAQEVLGLMIFKTCPVAHLMRAAGHSIQTQTEIEHAYVLTWMLGIVAEHGAGYWNVVWAKLKVMQEDVNAALGKSVPN